MPDPRLGVSFFDGFKKPAAPPEDFFAFEAFPSVQDVRLRADKRTEETHSHCPVGRSQRL